VITPRRALGRSTRFTVGIRYHGVPKNVTDPDGSPDGWIRTDTGAFVGSEPQGAMTWFPAISHPIDKSAFDVTMRVPKGYLAVGNGTLFAQKNTAQFTTTHWREQQPMAAYLATASIAKFQVRQYMIGRIPVFIAVDPREVAQSAPVLATLPAVIGWERSLFGPYPFGALGAIVMHAPKVGYALETDPPAVQPGPDETTLVPELAHQ
jgi:aminopeptidase N